MDRFDNTYISPLIEEIDRKRKDMKKETILPLNFREKFKYFKISKGTVFQKSRIKIYSNEILHLSLANS